MPDDIEGHVALHQHVVGAVHGHRLAELYWAGSGNIRTASIRCGS